MEDAAVLAGTFADDHARLGGAAAQLNVTWQTSPGFPQGSGNFWSWLRQAGDINTQNPGRYTTDSSTIGSADELERRCGGDAI